MSDPRPVLFVTNYLPASRTGAFEELARRTPVEFVLFGGRRRHGGLGDAGGAGLRTRTLRQREVHSLAASGGYRAVICGTNGRAALPGAFLGARRAGVPFVLWATLWAHPRSAAHALSWLPMRAIYRSADAVFTYGPHVSAYVRARGARNVVEAPHSADARFWSAPADAARRLAPFQAMFSGRLEREKGIPSLLCAWERAALPASALVLVGDGPLRSEAEARGAACTGHLAPEQVRNFCAGSDVVVLASVATRTFREPWGLALNEAMHQGKPVIASDAVGAVAGGLVRDRRNGLVVPAGDAGALAAALSELHGDADLRERLGTQAREDAAALTHDTWATGVMEALAQAGVKEGKI